MLLITIVFHGLISICFDTSKEENNLNNNVGYYILTFCAGFWLNSISKEKYMIVLKISHEFVDCNQRLYSPVTG
jgi:hypothetical protein